MIDSAILSTWTILDSVGVLDADGAGDMADGKINFRRRIAPGNQASATMKAKNVPCVASRG